VSRSHQAGGRKEPWSEDVRRKAMEFAERHGAVRAGAKFKIPPGTIRSWARRKALAEERARVDESGLAAVQAEGRRIVAEREAQLRDPEHAARAERERLEMIARIEAGSRRESGDESEEPS